MKNESDRAMVTNLQRVAETWLDDYADFFLKQTQSDKVKLNQHP